MNRPGTRTTLLLALVLGLWLACEKTKPQATPPSLTQPSAAQPSAPPPSAPRANEDRAEEMRRQAAAEFSRRQGAMVGASATRGKIAGESGYPRATGAGSGALPAPPAPAKAASPIHREVVLDLQPSVPRLSESRAEEMQRQSRQAAGEFSRRLGAMVGASAISGKTAGESGYPRTTGIGSGAPPSRPAPAAAAPPVPREVVADLQPQDSKSPSPAPAPKRAVPIGKPTSPAPNPVDEIVHNLASANVAFNTPESMTLGAAQSIQLLLSQVHSQEALAALVHGPGKVVTSEVKVHHRMSATLKVDPSDLDPNAFLIEPQTPEEQAISGEDTTEWNWKVTPKAVGKHALKLELSVIVYLDNSLIPRRITQISRPIEIVVPPPAKRTFLLPLLILVGVAALLAGLVLSRRRKPRSGGLGKVRSSDDPQLFISYARRNEAQVLPVVDGLTRLGFRIWMDQTGIDGATLWSQEIVESIGKSQVILVFASRDSFGSEFVIREILLASEERKPILPLYLEQVDIPSSVRLQLAGIQHLLLRSGQLEEDLGRIHQALIKLGVAPSPPAGN